MERDTPPVRLVVSMLAAREEPRLQAVSRLVQLWGPLSCLTQPLAFDYSGYYTPEMGAPLTRRLAAFIGLVAPHRLAEIKAACQEVEKELAIAGRRRVNLDPGLLGLGSLVLASTKHRPHRLAIAPGLWAELTLLYQSGGWRALPWTYPDYAGPELLAIMGLMRGRYLWQLRQAQQQGGAIA